MRRAAALLARHRRTLGPDFRRFYHLPLREALAGAMTVGELIDTLEDILTLDSSTARAINDGPLWQVEHYLLTDVVQSLTGKKHPARPKATPGRREQDPKFLAARERARQRARARQQQIASGHIT